MHHHIPNTALRIVKAKGNTKIYTFGVQILVGMAILSKNKGGGVAVNTILVSNQCLVWPFA